MNGDSPLFLIKSVSEEICKKKGTVPINQRRPYLTMHKSARTPSRQPIFFPSA